MQHLRYLVFVPARAGSKGVPNKNMRVLKGKPLVQWTFEAALESTHVDGIHCSSDDPHILELAQAMELTAFERPSELAQDDSKIIDVVLYHLDLLESQHQTKVEYLVLMQPTSPVREIGLLDRAIRTLEKTGKRSLIAVADVIQHPFDCLSLDEEGHAHYLTDFSKTTNRQSYGDFYFITGSLYIVSTQMLREKRVFMDENSYCLITSKDQNVDINDEIDWKIAEALI